MASYRLYCLDGEGKIHHADWIDAPDDENAVRQVRDLRHNSLKCEIWRGERLVATLDSRDLGD